MSIQFDNNASGTLSVEATAIATTLTLQTNEGQLFPPVTTVSGDFFYATLEDTAGNIEIVSCTNNDNANVLTVTRAQENTTGKVFPVGSKVELRTTAATFDEFIQRTGGTMTGLLDLNGNDLQDAVLTNTGAIAEIRGVPLMAPDGSATNAITIGNGADPQIGVNDIWHAGNDGTGTGLDADLLDGVEGAGYIKPADATVAASGDWTFTGDVQLDGDHTEAGFGTGGKVKDGGDVLQPIGYNVMPVVEQDISATFNIGSVGGIIHKDTTAAADYTLPNDADIPQGATWTMAIDAILGANLVRIKGATGVTVRYFDNVNAETVDVVAANGFTLSDASVVTIYKYTDTVYFLWGGGISASV
jgi:hypothetical protein